MRSAEDYEFEARRCDALRLVAEAEAKRYRFEADKNRSIARSLRKEQEQSTPETFRGFRK